MVLQLPIWISRWSKFFDDWRRRFEKEFFRLVITLLKDPKTFTGSATKSYLG